MLKKLLPGACLLFPFFAYAQGSVQSYLIAFGGFLNWYIIPLIFGFAFLMFLWGMFKFFFWSGASTEGREQGKSLALWGILAFVFFFSIWGLTNMLVDAFDIGGNTTICPDFYPNCK